MTKALKIQDMPYSPGYLLLTRERIEANYRVAANGCWEWRGAKTEFGYGKIGLKQNGAYHSFTAHRVYYYMVKGPIDESLVIDHLCRNPACINPDHLEAVSQRENNARGAGITANNTRKTVCDNGHPFTPDNTGRYAKTGWRYCRTCSRRRTNKRGSERTKEYHARGLNSKGKPLPDNWKKIYDVV